VSDRVNSGSEYGSASSEYALEQGVARPEDGNAGGVDEREGLPPGFRMRADRHYVDLMAAHSTDQPVRMVPLGQIDSDAAIPSGDLRLLIESIRTCGIVQPLLVRRRNARYAVVAGRKRFSAAQTLMLAAVPCLVHELDDTQALALASADNLVVGRAHHSSEQGSALAVVVREIVAHHLATITACSDLVSTGAPALTRPVFDLIRAHAWRAARLGDALNLITNAPQRPGRERALATIADDVIKGFEPESRLNDFTLRAQIRDDLSTSGLNDHDLLAGLSGAVLAVLPLVEHVVRPAVLIKGGAAGPGSVVLEVVQSDVAVPANATRHFLDDEMSNGRPGGYSAAAGALAAKALATRHGGTATFEATAHGSTLRMVLVRRS
jgi:hypothetical protein